MILGTVLIAAAAVLLLYNRYEDENAGRVAKILVPEIKIAADKANASDEATSDEARSAEMTTVEIDGYDYIGYLSIPGLKLELPVLSEWDYSRLKIAPCRQFGSIGTDDLVIAGHNYSNQFGLLSAIKTGDAVAFTVLNGSTVSYCVMDIRTIQPTEVDIVEHSGFDLTLYTCTYGGKTRIVVFCNRSEKK